LGEGEGGDGKGAREWPKYRKIQYKKFGLTLVEKIRFDTLGEYF
jgi:hypothetical protein